jgi:ABC-type phosphate transport system permease subunit
VFKAQDLAVPLAVVGAATVADRGRVHTSVRRLWLALTVLVVPPAILLGTLGFDRVLGVYAKGDHTIDAGSILMWIGREAMLLTYVQRATPTLINQLPDDVRSLPTDR